MKSLDGPILLEDAVDAAARLFLSILQRRSEEARTAVDPPTKRKRLNRRPVTDNRPTDFRHPKRKAKP